mmetsp:Transcript_73350/g.161987  ORF Transcript_73350/g.161987 Transcript_73350/m.161987 type:complete len:94 (-) Transcript_73350:80-361(-)
MTKRLIVYLFWMLQGTSILHGGLLCQMFSQQCSPMYLGSSQLLADTLKLACRNLKEFLRFKYIVDHCSKMMQNQQPIEALKGCVRSRSSGKKG